MFASHETDTNPTQPGAAAANNTGMSVGGDDHRSISLTTTHLISELLLAKRLAFHSALPVDGRRDPRPGQLQCILATGAKRRRGKRGKEAKEHHRDTTRLDSLQHARRWLEMRVDERTVCTRASVVGVRRK